MTFRRLLKVVLPNLPRQSAFKRAIDPDGARWGPAEYLLADVVDVLLGANWQRANEGSKNPSPQPDPYPRPGDNRAQQTQDQLKIAALQAQRDRALARRAEGDSIG